MTPETAAFLLELLNQQALPVNAPDFDQTVARIQTARSELLAIVDPATIPAYDGGQPTEGAES